MHNKNNVKDTNIINVKMKSFSLPNVLPPILLKNTSSQNNQNQCPQHLQPLQPLQPQPSDTDWVLIPKTNEEENEENEEHEEHEEDDSDGDENGDEESDYEKLKINGTTYYMEKLLHKSMVSKVYLAHTNNDSSKQHFAIKIYLSDFKNQAENEHKMIELLNTFSVPNIVQLINKKEGMLVMPHYERDLFDLIVQSQTTHRRFSGKSIKRYFTEIIDTLYKMHNHNIVHLDIKPENILVTNDHHIKLIDFGFAKHVKNKKNLYCSKGTPFYAAPEIDHYESGYDPYKADIWSLGTTFYLMLELRRPFHMDKVTDNSSSTVWKVIENETLTFSKRTGKEYHLMISNMLKKDPNERWTINEVKAENDRINDLIKVKLN